MGDLSLRVQYLKGIGPKRSKLLSKLGINNLEDLFYYKPEQYDDRTEFKKIGDVSNNEKATFKLKVVGPSMTIYPRRGMSILKIPVSDGESQAYMTWFNQEYMKFQIRYEQEYLVTGTKKFMAGELQISNPNIEEYIDGDKGKILPIYGLTQGLSNKVLEKIIDSALKEHYYKINEFLPGEILNKYGMMSRAQAIKNMHKPEDRISLIRALNRLKFEEFLLLQLGLFLIKSRFETGKMGAKYEARDLVENFLGQLPFKLTNAQVKVFNEISKDMESNRQMNRLVQGDVGSGKTIVALLAMLKAVDSGYQASMMAPTEILANQHYKSIKSYLEMFDLRVELLVGSLKKSEKDKVLEDLHRGDIDILVGTHAIIQESVVFKNLGLVVTDEQHRFGVNQRSAFTEKGLAPDILVMTATPIPRSLALILYGDLDISIIDQLPPGRKEIETYALGMNMISRVNSFIDEQVSMGRQAYIVCPLIEENDTLGVNSAEEVYYNLKNGDLAKRSLALLHGKMKNSEKDQVMTDFKNGKIDVLVATTVIEVGVDVANANIIVIYNGERFGLAQLHQLRGRVGRGNYQSYCIILNNGKNPVSLERMRVMQSSSDGFVISEKDLELRGPGEFFGTKQHGLPELRIANIFSDMKILKLAQSEAKKLLEADESLDDNDNRKIKEEIIKKFDKIDGISFN